MLESRIEKKLEDEVKKIGGKAYKFISPGMSGVPDRIVLLPGGRIYFVELKATNKKMRALQEYRAKELKKLGFDVRSIDSIDKIKEFIREVSRHEV